MVYKKTQKWYEWQKRLKENRQRVKSMPEYRLPSKDLKKIVLTWLNNMDSKRTIGSITLDEVAGLNKLLE